MKKIRILLVPLLVLLAVQAALGKPSTSLVDSKEDWQQDLLSSLQSSKDVQIEDTTKDSTDEREDNENESSDDINNLNAIVEELPYTTKDDKTVEAGSGEYSIGSDLIEGDIKTSTEQAAMFKKGGWDALVGIQAWYSEQVKWSRTIPYVINRDIYDHVRNSIKYSMDIFHRYTCLRFIPREAHHRDYLNFVNKRGCWSQVGRKGGRQEISLARGCYSAVPAHEIMHALGRFHEQSRPDRDSYVDIKTENIKKRALSNFRKHSNADTQNIPYDYGSVMHYSAFAFTRNRKPTIVPKIKGYLLGQRGTVSPTDILHVNMRYCQEKMVRLVGGRGPFEGRVEVNWKGQWGTVCDDLFGLSDGHAVCRYLGYPKAHKVFKKGFKFGKGRGPIWFDDMKCVGNEYSPFSCPMNKIGSHNCKHNEDVGVACQNNIRLVSSSSSTSGTNGRVEVYFRGKWGTICHDSTFDANAANVVCRQLGKTRVKRVYSMQARGSQEEEEGEEEGERQKGEGEEREEKGEKEEGQRRNEGERVVWLNGLKCTGGESQIGFCHSEPLGELKGACNHDVAVHCY